MISRLLLSATTLLVVILQLAHGETIELRVAHEYDDAEEALTDADANRPTGNVDRRSRDLELGAEGGGDDLQEVGVRFQNVTIPPGSIITGATIQFSVDATDTEPTSVRVTGELSLDPAQFSGTDFDITSRLKTTHFVDWNDIPVWENTAIGTGGPDQRTPDLSPIVQEIVGQPGWNGNHAMAFFFAPNPGGERTAVAFNGEPNSSPKLTIDYVPVPEPATFTFVALCLIWLLAFAPHHHGNT